MSTGSYGSRTSSSGNSGSKERNGIIPFQRIQELEYFYTSDSVKNDKVIEVVDMKEKKKFSEEVQGQWALDQIEAVLDILRIRAFVVPKDKTGVEIPIIRSREEYYEAHLQSKSRTFDNIMDSQEARMAYIDILRAKMIAAKGRRETVVAGMNNPDNEDEEANVDNDNQQQEVNIGNEMAEANEEYVKAYSKWNKEQQAQNEDLMRQESMIETCRRQSSRQHDEDADAVNRLLSALFALKKFIQGLIKRFSFLEEIVRQKRRDGIDPYDENDLRSCYINLLDRFRQSDEMGILTTIMSGMGEKQGKNSMSTFLLSVEDWHQTMIRMGVQSISMSDLAAIITLKGMNENHRIEFLQQENALELTLDTLDQEDEDISDDESSTQTVKKEKKSLLVRVKRFVQQDKTKRLINQRLSGGSGISTTSSDGINARKEAEARLKEAQNVFVATLDKSVCKAFASTGKCKFGESCRFKHDDAISSKVKAVSNSTGKGICFQWRDNNGKCRFGDACNFKHGDGDSKPEQVTTLIKDKHDEGKKREKQSKVNQTLFSIDDQDSSWGNNDEKLACIITSEEDAVCEETVLNVKKIKSSSKLGWDTMASIHVSSDKATLSGLTELRSKRSASGMGGTLPITHTGYNSMFNLQMHVIPGGNTPNIKSIGKSLQRDGDGKEYAAIFTARGATQLTLTSRAKNQIMQILEEAEMDQNIVGTAIQRNGIYEESFGEEDEEELSKSLTEEEKAFAVTSMYTNRVPMSAADDIIGMLASACVKEEHLITGIKQNSIKGLPECVTEEAVKQYFKMHGKDKDIIMAEIANAPLKVPIDYEKEEFHDPGEHLQMDNVDPSFARIKNEKTPVRSIGGFRDAVIALDNCGYSVVHGREKKKDPHLIVKRFMEKWMAKWQSLKKISADKEFVTLETMILCEKADIRVRQAVPYDHRRGLGASEGLNRWIQDSAQAHMNRLSTYVHLGLMTEHDKRSLWFHALTYANDVKLLAPSKTNHNKTQFEEGEKVKFNFSIHVILPFGLRVVIRKKQGDHDGRGIDGIYVGFSKVVAGGILVYVFKTKRVVQKYTFIPREPMPSLTDIDCEYAALALYGDISVVAGDTKDIFIARDTLNSQKELKVEGVTAGDHVDQRTLVVDEEHKKKSKMVKVKPVNNHFTRSKQIRDMVLHVSETRPPKPKLPTRQAAAQSDRWCAAYRREIRKINEEETMQGLEADTKGNFVRPDNAIVMKLLAILEWKWKPDPETGVEGWLECVRIVCDGSADKREGEITYAETPDRTLMFLMASIEATLGIRSKVGDAVRAYLNAPSLDKNLVVIADRVMTGGKGLERFSKESILLKGLYGSTKGALSFQVWADMKLAEINYQKCDVARGVYLKTVEDEIVRLYRHSDDFKLSASTEKLVNNEVEQVQSKIRTTPFKKFKDFLGCTFVRFDSNTMNEDEGGDIFLVTMIEQINKLEVDFGHLSKAYNPTGRVRYTPLPLKPVIDEDSLSEVQRQLLPEDDVKEYMSLVMSLGWVIGNIRPNLKYSHHIMAKRLACPRTWDVYLAVWVLDHIILTKEWPLVLGGPKVDPEVFSDSSFASMEERRTVGGHCLVTAKGSGVIHAQVKTYKVSVKSIFEGENMAASDGQDTMIYADSVVEELKYQSKKGSRVNVDNTAVIDWMLGSVPSKRSKHMEVRLYRSRHLVQDGKIVMEYVKTEENIADLLTKSLPRKQYEHLVKVMLGHTLVREDLRFWET